MADANSSKTTPNVNLPSSRAEAKECGSSRYFNGNPCKQGHVAERLAVNGSCCECQAQKSKKQYWKNRDENLRKQKERRDSDPDLNRKKRERRYAADPELKARQEARARENAVRDAARATGQTIYLSTKPCPHGHEAYRFVRDAKCVECNRVACAERARRKREADPEAMARREAEARARAIRKADSDRRSRIRRQSAQARKEAQERGEVIYESLKPCPHGHVGKRYTSGGNCVECAAIQSASEEKKRYDLAYYRENVERIRARTRVYNEATREQRVEQAKRWRKANPEKRKAIIRNYSARRRAQEEGGITTAELAEWTAAQKKVCYWCGNKCADDFHVDHYVPLSKGGAHQAENLVIACSTCNVRKSAKDPYEFAASVGRLF